VVAQVNHFIHMQDLRADIQSQARALEKRGLLVHLRQQSRLLSAQGASLSETSRPSRRPLI